MGHEQTNTVEPWNTQMMDTRKELKHLLSSERKRRFLYEQAVAAANKYTERNKDKPNRLRGEKHPFLYIVGSNGALIIASAHGRWHQNAFTYDRIYP